MVWQIRFALFLISIASSSLTMAQEKPKTAKLDPAMDVNRAVRGRRVARCDAVGN